MAIDMELFGARFILKFEGVDPVEGYVSAADPDIGITCKAMDRASMISIFLNAAAYDNMIPLVEKESWRASAEEHINDTIGKEGHILCLNKKSVEAGRTGDAPERYMELYEKIKESILSGKDINHEAINLDDRSETQGQTGTLNCAF